VYKFPGTFLSVRYPFTFNASVPLPLPLITWSPLKTLEPVVAKLPVSTLPLTSGIFTANVLASPFVNVRLRVPLLKLAVIKKLPLSASVTYDDVAAIRESICDCCAALLLLMN